MTSEKTSSSLNTVDEKVNIPTLSNNHPFLQPEIANYWSNVYENAKYENRHRFDPKFEWTPEEEKKTLRKTDIKILLWSWVMFFSLDLIRQNLSKLLVFFFYLKK